MTITSLGIDLGKTLNSVVGMDAIRHGARFDGAKGRTAAV